MPNQRDPNKAFLGGYFPSTVVRKFHRASVTAGYATHVECLDRLIRDFIKVRGEAGNGKAGKAKARTTAASP